MGKVFHSCGHEDRYKPISGWPISMKEIVTDYYTGETRGVSHLTLCHDCYIKYIKNYPEEVLMTPLEEWEYLSNNEVD